MIALLAVLAGIMAGAVSAQRLDQIGPDPASGERLHQIDFSAYRVTGSGYPLPFASADYGAHILLIEPGGFGRSGGSDRHHPHDRPFTTDG